MLFEAGFFLLCSSLSYVLVRFGKTIGSKPLPPAPVEPVVEDFSDYPVPKRVSATQSPSVRDLVMPDQIKEFAALEQSADGGTWAQDLVLARAQALYKELGDWDKVYQVLEKDAS